MPEGGPAVTGAYEATMRSLLAGDPDSARILLQSKQLTDLERARLGRLIRAASTLNERTQL